MMLFGVLRDVMLTSLNLQTPTLAWEIKEQCKPYNPTLEKCNLCLNKKFIDDPHKNLLNKRSEV